MKKIKYSVLLLTSFCFIKTNCYALIVTPGSMTSLRSALSGSSCGDLNFGIISISGNGTSDITIPSSGGSATQTGNFTLDDGTGYIKSYGCIDISGESAFAHPTGSLSNNAVIITLPTNGSSSMTNQTSGKTGVIPLKNFEMTADIGNLSGNILTLTQQGNGRIHIGATAEVNANATNPATEAGEYSGTYTVSIDYY